MANLIATKRNCNRAQPYVKTVFIVYAVYTMCTIRCVALFWRHPGFGKLSFCNKVYVNRPSLPMLKCKTSYFVYYTGCVITLQTCRNKEPAYFVVPQIASCTTLFRDRLGLITTSTYSHISKSTRPVLPNESQQQSNGAMFRFACP